MLDSDTLDDVSSIGVVCDGTSFLSLRSGI